MRLFRVAVASCRRRIFVSWETHVPETKVFWISLEPPHRSPATESLQDLIPWPFPAVSRTVPSVEIAPQNRR